MSAVGPALAAGAAVAIPVLLVVLASRRLAQWFEPDGDGWDVAVAALVVGLTGVVVVATVLAATGLLDRATLPVAVSAAALAVLVARPGATQTATGGERAGQRAAGVRVADLTVAVAAAVVAAVYLATGLGGRSSSSDTRQYHLPILGWLLRHGSLWDLPFAVPGYAYHAFPMASELSGALLVAATGSDHLVHVTVLPWIALAVAGAAVAGRELGGDPAWSALGALAVVVTPLVVWTQASSLKPDVAAAAGVVAATGLVLRLRREPIARRTMILAGLALGLSTASKYTAFGPAVALVILAAVVVPAARRWSVVGGLVAGVSALTGVWLLRNAVLTGNPVFPLGVGPLTGADSPLTAFEEPLLAHVAAGRLEPLRTWFSLARSFYGPALVFPVAALVALAWPGSRLRRLVAALGLVCGLLYAATPYTGGGEGGVAFLIGSQLRYALPAILLAAPVACSLLRGWTLVPVSATMMWSLWRLADGTPSRPEVDLGLPAALWTAILLGSVLVHVVLRRRTSRPAPPRVMTLALGAALWAVATGALLVQGDRPTSTVERLLDGLDRQRGPVAVAFVNDVRSLQGERFDIDLVRVSGGGAAGERPVLSGDRLDRELLALDAPVLAVDLGAGAPVLPPGWAPAPPWRLAATDGRTELYVRDG